MKKKLVAMLLALATLLTLLPVTAMAADCRHKDSRKQYSSNGNSTHKIYCRDCRKDVEAAEACTPSRNNPQKCSKCNGTICDHTPKAPTPNGDGTHTSKCDCGKESVDGDCTYDEDGICTVCEGACAHTNTTLKSNGIWNHSNYCDDCEVAVSTTNHYYNFFTHLCNCGDVDPLFQMFCPHNHHHLVNNGINHKVVCNLCQFVHYYEPHGYNASGVCSCGATKGPCTHTNIDYVSKGSEYNTICADCGIILSSSHTHEYNIFDRCTICGAVNPNVAEPEPTEPAPTYPSNAWDHLDELFTTHK